MPNTSVNRDESAPRSAAPKTTGYGYRFIKRAFDIVASVIVTLLCLIPMAVIAVMIVVKDPGDPFYLHKRVGMYGKEISVLKFRTMRRDADGLEDTLTPQQIQEYKREFKLRDDPRLIGYKGPGDGRRCFGALLRQLSLDELPQVFYNVLLKGDMSFVGPRPVLREELEKYYGPEERRALLSVKPGVTGYWQTHGRSDSTYETGKRQQLELYYVENHSVALDLKIFFMTIFVVVRRGGNILNGNVLSLRTASLFSGLPRVVKLSLCLPLLQVMPGAGTGKNSGTEPESAKKKPEAGIAYRFLKRAFDIVASAIGLVVLSPLFLVVSLLIVLDDPKGPPVFVQTRVGKDGKEFRFYKFRSMVVDAEEQLDSLMDRNEMDGPVFKIKDDPRVTRVGRFIRRPSIDELPQLWNVLRGDMSIVGPRPPLPLEVARYNDYQRQRLSVVPGLTCYWQVRKDRNLCSFDEWVEMDLRYIRERSVWTDLKLIFKTFGAVLGMSGE